MKCIVGIRPAVLTSNVDTVRENRFYEVKVRFRPYEAFGNDPRLAKKPTKIVWSAPVDVEDITVPVEFKDLSLP